MPQPQVTIEHSGALSTTAVGAALPVRPPLFDDTELAEFKARIAPLIGLDLEAYKPRQIERRITALLCRSGLTTLTAFYDQLEQDPQRLKDFVDGLTINVSEFFRNPDKFEELRQDILPMLLARGGPLKVWSAGCSMGAELYSVGMLLAELGALDRAELIGTDLDREILKRAESGLYGAHELKAVSTERLARFFTEADGQARFSDEAIRARCHFRRQNLLEDPPEPGCHLILCRNVVIYLNDAAKQHLYRQFREALVPGGVLFVGGTERIFGHRDLDLQLHSTFFYRRTDAEGTGTAPATGD